MEGNLVISPSPALHGTAKPEPVGPSGSLGDPLPHPAEHHSNGTAGAVVEAPATTEVQHAKPTEVVVPVVNPSPTPSESTPQQDHTALPVGDGALTIAIKEEDEEEGDNLGKYPPSVLVATKLLIGSWLLKGARPVVAGSSSPDPSEKSLFNIEVRLIYGRRPRVKYEINQPGARLMIDYELNAISGVAFKLDTTKIMVVELSERPTFSAREDGKWVRVLDFTQGNASCYRRHYIEFYANDFAIHVERLLEFDPRLKSLAEIGLAEVSADPSFASAAQTRLCDWDRENIALVHCSDCGEQSYCAECDEVLHRPPDKRNHKRIPMDQVDQSVVATTAPHSPNTANYAIQAHTPHHHHSTPTHGGSAGKKRKKKKKSATCRCGTGATKGTLGEPCTGNRCPCYSEVRGCSGCGCKNCQNPHNDIEKIKSPEEEEATPMST